MKKNKSLLALFLVFMLVYSLSVIGSPTQPIGVGGRLKIAGEYTANITVSITDVNTGEIHNKLTETGGFYACALEADDGDVIKISCSYEGNLYENTTIADTSLLTNWLNLTIIIEEDDDNGDNGNGGWNPSPPPDESNSPVADFTISPEHPVIWDIITFTDTSTDQDDDIIARTWNIDGHSHTTIVVQCAFLKPGNYSALLLVMDSEGNTDTIEKTVRVYSPPPDDNMDGDVNDTSDNVPLDNITLTFNVTDQSGNPLCCTDVYVYDENYSLVAFAVTNNTGKVSVNVPPGYYIINASKNDVTVSKDMLFSGNGSVPFTLLVNGGVPPAGFNWWLVVLPVIIFLALITGVFIWKKKYLVKS